MCPHPAGRGLGYYSDRNPDRVIAEPGRQEHDVRDHGRMVEITPVEMMRPEPIVRLVIDERDRGADDAAENRSPHDEPEERSSECARIQPGVDSDIIQIGIQIASSPNRVVRNTMYAIMGGWSR